VLQNTRFQGQDGYFFFMGTSMASPHVAGVAALIVAQGVTDPDAVREVLVKSARRPAGMDDAPDFAEHYGAGLVDAGAAVTRAQLGQGERELGLGAALGGALLLLLARRGRLGAFGLAGWAALVVGASGLFFLARIGLGGLPGAAILSHGFPAWDQALLGAAGHGNPLFYSALAPVALVALGYSLPRMRGVLAGFAFGVAGHLVAQIVAPTVDIRYLPADALWLGANAALAATVGYLVARR
jgi:serine protease